MWAPVVHQGATFAKDVEELREKYPEIDAVIAELMETLIGAWNVPHRRVTGHANPNIYFVWLDYPPAGAAGIQLFRMTYHASPEAVNKMRDPLRTYTLLTLTERRPDP